ncbi:MAG: carbohydrate kinase family protein [Terriglobales bacterium]
MNKPRFDVTIAGELNLDLILYGLPADLSPERELLADRMVLTLGSSSAIVAHNLASLGSQVGFQSLIGRDPLGQIALERLARSGVDTARVRKSESLGTGLSVILQRDKWRNILTYAGTITRLSFDDLDLDYLSDARHFHLSSYYLQTGLRPHVPELFRRLKAAGLTISLDTNDDPEDRFEGDLRQLLNQVDIFLPNRREACKIAATDNLEAAMKKLSEVVPLVVVKLGAEGAVALRNNEKIVSAALKVNTVDPVGAGDSFDAGFLYAYLKGESLERCMAVGNVAGALCATRPGGTEAFYDREHREKFFREHAPRLLSPPA